MKKPFKEEKQDSKVVKNKFYFLALFFFFSIKIFPQIPVNGFCKFSNYKVPSGYNSLFALNYNNDSYTDLILYNPDKKSIVSVPGSRNGNFGIPIISKIPYQITNIQNINDINSPVKKYAFTSRQNRIVGIYSFLSSGRAILSRKIKFDSYPESISATDINGNGKDELLISGPAFNGLSVLYLTHSGIIKKSIYRGRSFSDAIFADLNNDGLPDIAAFDIMNNSISFFFNMGDNKFKEIRSFNLNEKISLLRSVDLNLDHYPDLIFAKGKSIEIMFGDSIASFNNIETIHTIYKPDQIITGDFNHDGKIDIAYINKENQTLSILYAGNNGFYPEEIYIQKKGLENLVPYYSKFISGIEAVSSKGEIYSILKLSSLLENVSLVFSPNPRNITYFDRNNNGIIDLCYIDSLTQSLDLVVRNNSGIPDLLYTVKLSQYHTQILVDNTDPEVKTFYCFDYGQKLIEIIKIDFRNNNINRDYIYSLGAIKDIRISRDNDGSPVINIAFINNDKLGLSIVQYHNYRYDYSNFQGIASNIDAVNISRKKEISLYCWQSSGDSISLNNYYLNNDIFAKNNLMKFGNVTPSSITLLTADFLNKDSEENLSFINFGNESKAVFTRGKSKYILRNKDLINTFDPASGIKYYFGEIRNGGLKYLFVYNNLKKNISRIDFLSGGREVIPVKITDAENLQSYFIKNLSFRKIHLVYIDKDENCINIKRLQ